MRAFRMYDIEGTGRLTGPELKAALHAADDAAELESSSSAGGMAAAGGATGGATGGAGGGAGGGGGEGGGDGEGQSPPQEMFAPGTPSMGRSAVFESASRLVDASNQVKEEKMNMNMFPRTPSRTHIGSIYPPSCVCVCVCVCVYVSCDDECFNVSCCPHQPILITSTYRLPSRVPSRVPPLSPYLFCRRRLLWKTCAACWRVLASGGTNGGDTTSSFHWWRRRLCVVSSTWHRYDTF